MLAPNRINRMPLRPRSVAFARIDRGELAGKRSSICFIRARPAGVGAL
jgi:hypothetical protein